MTGTFLCTYRDMESSDQTEYLNILYVSGKSVVREESTKVDQRRRGDNVYGVYLSRKIHQNAQEAPL